MLGKNVPDVGLTELGGPRVETTGTQGFGAAVSGIKAAGAGFAAGTAAAKAKAAAEREGRLTYDFLAGSQRAGLETEGFRQLTDEDKNSVLLGVNDFDNKLQQAVESRGARADVKADILRTRKVMKLIAQRPDQASQIIAAAGLADKVAKPLNDALKEEEDSRIAARKALADNYREQGDRVGHEWDADVYENDLEVIKHAEMDDEFIQIRQTDALMEQARSLEAQQKAEAIPTAHAIRQTSAINASELMRTAIALGATGGQDAAAELTLLSQNQMAGILVDYGSASEETIASAQQAHRVALNEALKFINGDYPASQASLISQYLSNTAKRIGIKSSDLKLRLDEKYLEKERVLKVNGQTITNITDSIKAGQMVQDATVSRGPGLNPLLDTPEQIEAGVALARLWTSDAVASSYSAMAETSEDPLIRAAAIGVGLKSWLSGDGEEIANINPEQVDAQLGELAKALPAMERLTPSVYRSFINDVTAKAGNSKNLDTLFEQYPAQMQPLGDIVSTEVAHKIEGSIVDTIAEAYKLKNTGVFNLEGTRNIANTFASVISDAIDRSFLNPEFSDGAIDQDIRLGTGETQKQFWTRTKSELANLSANPQASTMITSLGAVMMIDESAINKGQFKYKLRPEIAGSIQDQDFLENLEVGLSRINSSVSRPITKDLQTLMTTRNYDNMEEALLEVITFRGGLGLTNLYRAQGPN